MLALFALLLASSATRTDAGTAMATTPGTEQWQERQELIAKDRADATASGEAATVQKSVGGMNALGFILTLAIVLILMVFALFVILLFSAFWIAAPTLAPLAAVSPVTLAVGAVVGAVGAAVAGIGRFVSKIF